MSTRQLVARQQAKAVVIAVGFLFGSGVVAASLFVSVDVLAVSDRSSLLPTLVSGLGIPVGFVMVGGWYLSRRQDGIPLRVPTRSEVKWIVAGSLLFLGMSYAAVTVVTVLDINAVGNTPRAYDSAWVIGRTLISITVTAISEEILFRGAIQGALRRTFGLFGTVLIASVLFAPLHALSFGGELLGIGLFSGALFLGSLVLGVAYERTGNLAVPIAIHAIYNASMHLTAATGLT